MNEVAPSPKQGQEIEEELEKFLIEDRKMGRETKTYFMKKITELLKARAREMRARRIQVTLEDLHDIFKCTNSFMESSPELLSSGFNQPYLIVAYFFT